MFYEAVNESVYNVKPLELSIFKKRHYINYLIIGPLLYLMLKEGSETQREVLPLA